MIFPPYDSWIQKFLEEQRRIEKLLNPSYDIIRQHQSLLDSINIPSQEYQRSILEQANIRDYLSIAGISNDFLSMQEQIRNSFDSIDAISKELELLQKSTYFDSVIKAQENIYLLQDEFAKFRDLYEPPSARIESVLAAAEATTRMYQPHDFFLDFTLSSVAEYQSFLGKQYQLILHDNEIIADRRIQIAELSGGLLEIINASLDIGVALEGQKNDQSKEFIDDKIIKCGLYGHINQHLGVVYSDRYRGEVETSFNKSIPARIPVLGYAITEQIYKINSICENNGQEQIFKPTSRTMRACAIIPSLIATSEADFYLLIDHLFFLLYEGSGNANRLAPILGSSLLEPLWKVKHLRLAARHDIDHGSKSDIEKKRAQIKDTYISLISQPLPVKQGDWQKAQLQIYVEIEFLLQKIIQEITKNMD